MEFQFGYHLRVRFSETDAQAVVHNSQYLVYFEVGRIEYLRKLGMSYVDLIEKGFDFLLIVSHIEYKRPALFDQMLYLEVALEWIKRSSFQFSYRLTDATTGFLVAEGHTIHATVDHATLKPCGFPKELISLIQEFEGRELTRPGLHS